MSPPTLSLKDKSLFKEQGFINGKFVSAKSGKTMEVKDPATNNVIGTMPDMDAEDTQLAIDAAAAAFPSYRKTLPKERSRWLYKWAQLIMDNVDDLAQLITWENGKPLSGSRGEVVYAADYFEWFAGEAVRLYGDNIPASFPGRIIHTRKEPVGVVGLITPWNWPAGMPARKIG
jgi:succinate-semialdehyde dehydrogenase / glutarate-semialdehyde dehydrogenase